MRSSLLPVLAASAPFLHVASAHSWVDMLRNIASNGSFTGVPGYSRGYFDHLKPGFADTSMVYFVEQNGPNPSMCKSTQQGGTPQPAGYPSLQAAPGSMIALLYQENGHVTLPQNVPNKQQNGGTIYVYGTAQPKDNETFYDIHKVWNTDGTGGDKRGKLLTTQNFDDGQCYQKNPGTISQARQKQFPISKASDPEGEDLWCQTNLMLPQEAQTGKLYSLYWVWDWPTSPTSADPKGMNQTYTTCMDVQVAGGSNSKAAQSIKYVQNPEVQAAALPSAVSQLAKGSNFYAQTTATNGGAGSGDPATGSAPAASAPAGQTSSAAAAPPASTPAAAPSAAGGASSGSLVVIPVPTAPGSALSAPASSPASSNAVTSQAATSAPAPAPTASSLVVSVSIETVTITAPAVPAISAPATPAGSSPVLSEASSGSMGLPVAPVSTAPIAAVASSAAAAPSPACKPSGVQKRSVIFGDKRSRIFQGTTEDSITKREELVEEPMEETLITRTSPKFERRSAKFIGLYPAGLEKTTRSREKTWG